MFNFLKKTPSIQDTAVPPTVEQLKKAAGDLIQYEHQIAVINANKTQQYHKIDTEFAPDLEKATVARLEAEQVIKTYTEANKDILFSDKKKSSSIGEVAFGYRKTKAKFAFLDGFDAEKVKEACKKILPKYVRKVEEVELDKLLKDRKIDVVSKSLSELGLSVIEKDEFFCKVISA